MCSGLKGLTKNRLLTQLARHCKQKSPIRSVCPTIFLELTKIKEDHFEFGYKNTIRRKLFVGLIGFRDGEILDRLLWGDIGLVVYRLLANHEVESRRSSSSQHTRHFSASRFLKIR